MGSEEKDRYDVEQKTRCPTETEWDTSGGVDLGAVENYCLVMSVSKIL